MEDIILEDMVLNPGRHDLRIQYSQHCELPNALFLPNEKFGKTGRNCDIIFPPIPTRDDGFGV